MMEVLDGRGQKEELENDKGSYVADRELKRMYSFKQLFDMHRVLNNNSEVHDRVSKNEEDIQSIFEDLTNVKNLIKSLRKYTDNEIKEFK